MGPNPTPQPLLSPSFSAARFPASRRGDFKRAPSGPTLPSRRGQRISQIATALEPLRPAALTRMSLVRRHRRKIGHAIGHNPDQYLKYLDYHKNAMTSDRPNQPLESVQRIEPARLENSPERVADLAAELSAASARLGRSLHARTAANLADLVRIMNTYYSNLIEGHDTRPRDIERALAGEFDRDEGRRNLQVEAAAHVRVQAEVDRMAGLAALPEPASQEFIQWLHREFYRGAPEAMLTITGVGREFTMTPGEWRSQPEHDVAVGRHQPPSSARVDDFMRYFAERYRFEGIGRAGRIMAMAAAHHRFNYIHPFPDGNGRVSRLMSHAMAWRADVAAHGLWSISRGLARGLESRTEYKQMMDLADTPRQGDLDGRGNLSERALVDFVTWFLRVALDQVTFMSELFDLDNLATRLRNAHRASRAVQAARPLHCWSRRWCVARSNAARHRGSRAFLFGRRSASSTTWSTKACWRRRRRKVRFRCAFRRMPLTRFFRVCTLWRRKAICSGRPRLEASFDRLLVTGQRVGAEPCT